MRHRADIEGLRAVAVILVVLFHAGVPLFAGGYLGVDVFFVLSGFLITTLMLAEIESTGRLSLVGFYGRRARRLLPAATMVVAVTVVVGWFVLSPLTRRELVSDAFSATTYTANLRFAAESTDYLQSDEAPSALRHFWSLAVEEQFYLCWPLVMVALAGRRRRRSRMALGIGCVVVVSFVACQVLTVRSQPWAFFSLPTRAWQLGLGALLAVGWPMIERLPRAVRTVIPVLGLGTMVGAATVFDASTTWPGTAAVVPAVATVLVLAGIGGAPSGRLLADRRLGWIGARSYSWYLWHWPALVLTAVWLGRPLSVPLAIAISLGSLGLAHLGYELVEQRVRFLPALVRSGPRSLVSGLALGAVGALCLVALRPVAARIDASGPEVAAPARLDGPAPGRAPVDLLDTSATTLVVPANLRPSLSDVRDDEPSVYADGCHLDFTAIEPKVCEYGDPAGVATVVVVGDSHAAQWVPAFDEISRRDGLRLVPMTKSGCPAADISVAPSGLGREYTECSAWRENVFELVRELSPEIVLVASASRYAPLGEGGEDVVLEAGLTRTLEALAASGADVVLLGDTPYPAGDVPDCLSDHMNDARACTTTVEAAVALHKVTLEGRAASAVGARYLPVRDLVCGSTRCPVVVGDLLVYRDASHLTTEYARWAGDELVARLGVAWPKAERLSE